MIGGADTKGYLMQLGVPEQAIQLVHNAICLLMNVGDISVSSPQSVCLHISEAGLFAIIESGDGNDPSTIFCSQPDYATFLPDLIDLINASGSWIVIEDQECLDQWSTKVFDLIEPYRLTTDSEAE